MEGQSTDESLGERKPFVFIACASSANALAEDLKARLGARVTAHVWTEYKIQTEEGRLLDRGEVMANLFKTARVYDFVLVLLGPHQIVSARVDHLGEPKKGLDAAAAPEAAPDRHRPNDNVLFELGLFMGALGAGRTLAIFEPGIRPQDIGLPSDIFGHHFPLARSVDQGDDGPAHILTFASDAGERTRQADKIAKVILDSFRKVGVTYLPSTGLAMGYFRNFITPLAKLLSDGAFEINGELHAFAPNRCQLKIVIPLSLVGAGLDGLGAFLRVNEGALEEVEIKPPGAPPNVRGFKVFRRKVDDRAAVEIVDYPTPLRASLEAVEFVMKDELDPLGRIDFHQDGVTVRDLLETRELNNFEKTLALLQHEAKVAKEHFPNQVMICRQDPSKPFAWT